MSLDLYKLYKQFYQRSYRKPYDEDLAEMTRLAYEIAKKSYLEILHKKISQQETKQELLALAEELSDLEVNSRPGMIFSRNLVASILRDDFSCNVPPEKVQEWNEVQDYFGYIYMFSAKSRPGEVKVGKTSLEPRVRAMKYSSKFGYDVSVICYAEVVSPTKAEKQLAKLLQPCRVCGCTWGDSNEWYSMELDEAKKCFEDFVIRYSKT